MEIFEGSPLKGKVALVTGGSRGLGAATVLALAGQGASVAFSYVSPSSEGKAKAIVARIEASGGRAVAFRADQSDVNAAERLPLDVAESFGRVDILVNNASIDVFGKVDDPQRDQEAFIKFWNVAVHGFMATVRSASRVLSDRGRIIFIGSNLGRRVGMPGLADMAAIKAAIDGYARGVARDLSDREITVNVVHAGFMETDLNASSREQIAPLLERLCLKRFGRLEEVVAPILFLANPAASYVTGSIIDVDGGYNA